MQLRNRRSVPDSQTFDFCRLRFLVLHFERVTGLFFAPVVLGPPDSKTCLEEGQIMCRKEQF